MMLIQQLEGLSMTLNTMAPNLDEPPNQTARGSDKQADIIRADQSGARGI
jgi:hypothetical protein